MKKILGYIKTGIDVAGEWLNKFLQPVVRKSIYAVLAALGSLFVVMGWDTGEGLLTNLLDQAYEIAASLSLIMAAVKTTFLNLFDDYTDADSDFDPETFDENADGE